jgi:hypothetical protein
MKKKNNRGKKKTTGKKNIKPTKKTTQPKKKATKQGKKAKKPAHKKSYRLYLKGKPLTKFFKGAVERTAEAGKHDVSTPEKLHKFYNDNYALFEKRFTKGETSFKRGTPETIDQLEDIYNRGHDIYLTVGEDGKIRKVTLEQAVYEITMTERYLNRLLDTTGFTISYVQTYDGTVQINLPTREDEPEWLDMSVEEIVEYLFDTYRIVVYMSEPTADTSDEKKDQIKQRKETYSSRIDERKFIATEAVKELKATSKKATSEKKKRKGRK